MLFVVGPEDEESTLRTLRQHPLGAHAVTIARVSADDAGLLLVHTALGSTYVLDIPAGEELPRIC